MSFGLIEMGLVFGAVLVFAIYELVSVRRSLRTDKAREDDARDVDRAPLDT